MTVRIAPLAAAAPDRVEALLDAAFGADRRGRTAYRLREGLSPLPALSFAAFDDAALVGVLQSWPVALDDAPLVLVGPVAVLPDVQQGGIGRTMMDALIAAAGPQPMTMIGDPEYYGRFFGFSADATGEWALPGPVERRRLLAKHAAHLTRTGRLHAFAPETLSA
ncbi:GNAT family N-acetyltransferase [Sphingomonas antarctica]|uniref:GNAT family N-acetyltransferase n=1 Tax=Sphingomonas antarctica TaxID=2040274 RepID=UPI0039EA5618